MTRWIVGLVLLALVFRVAEKSAVAENACPPGNVLARAKVSGPLPEEQLAILTDGAVVREGSPWPAPGTYLALRGPIT